MTGTDPVETALVELGQGLRRWQAMGLADRAALLRRTAECVLDAADEWVETACGYKGLDPESALAGEEWLGGPVAVHWALTSFAGSLETLAAGESPTVGLPLTGAPGGRQALRVLPRRAADRLLLSGFQAQAWFPPGVGDDEIRSAAGRSVLPGSAGGIGLVLGAGNVTSIPVLDVLTELVQHHRVVLLKLNPITDAMLPVFTTALAPLLQANLLRIVTGDGEAGRRLTIHPAIDHIHLTGSGATYRAVVKGLRGRMTPVTAELGGVSPVIVVPGRWSRRDLRFQAEQVATMRLQNNGYNCIAGQVLIVSADWPQREEFLAEVRAAIQRTPRRPDYYPGSAERAAAAIAGHDRAEDLDGRVLLPAVPAGDPALRTEFFAPVLAVTHLPGSGADFLRRAVDFANDELDGTLGANVLIHPRTKAAAGAAFDELIAGLRYGTIAVNTWTALGFLISEAPWGGFPDPEWTAAQRDGAVRPADPGSGIGQVHNSLLLDGVERVVVTGPFRPFPRGIVCRGSRTILPKPPWFVTNRTAARTARAVLKYRATGKLRHLPGLFLSALRG